MAAIPYYHINSFTNNPFAGNPAGVCILPAFLSDTFMQKIAAENKHSQTAFVVQQTKTDFDLRWFTPEVEDDLCGHATLAAAFVLSLRGQSKWPIHFHTRSGVLTINQHNQAFEMDFPLWQPEPCDPPTNLLPSLGLETDLVFKTRDYLVVATSEKQVRTLSPDISALAKIEMGMGGVIVTAPGEDGEDYVLRFFAPSVGIDEDPATGSIHCTLAPYWADRLGKRKLFAKQLSKRGGELQCEVDGNRIKIIGHACLYLQGTIEI